MELIRRFPGGAGAVVVFALVAGCARPLPPPGGPADTVAPAVASVWPESLAVGVPVDAEIRFVFTERVDESTFERAIWVTPEGLVKPRLSFSGETATLRLGTPLPDSTTVGVLLTTVVRDRRRDAQANVMQEPYRWIFSTGGALWPGVVRGQLERPAADQDRRRQGQVLVGLYEALGDSLPDPNAQPPLAITQADARDRYRLDGLPDDGRGAWLFAMVDRDGNREIRGPGEYVTARPESVSLGPGAFELEIPLHLVDPAAPGEVTGLFARAAEDSVDLWAALYPAEEDSLARPQVQAAVGDDGHFKLARVPAGRYRVVAYCDANANRTRDPEETWTVYEDLVAVEPGETRDLGALAAPACVP